MIAKIAPVIHEWTYDAMCHDLLEMDGNKYIYEVLFDITLCTRHILSSLSLFFDLLFCWKVSKGDSEPEKKEALLEDQDPLWIELRHTHIADVSLVGI